MASIATERMPLEPERSRGHPIGWKGKGRRAGYLLQLGWLAGHFATRQPPRSAASVILWRRKEGRNSWSKDSWRAGSSDTWRREWDVGEVVESSLDIVEGRQSAGMDKAERSNALVAASRIPQFHFISSLLLLNFILHFVKILTSPLISFSISSPPHIRGLNYIILPSTPQ